MDAEYTNVYDAILLAKARSIMDTITRLSPLQFAISTLLALRQTQDQQSTCTDGCGCLFTKCPRWHDNSDGLNWVKSVLQSYTPPTDSSICGTCLLPNRPNDEIHPLSHIAVNHDHTEDEEATPDTPTKLDIFGPGLLLLKKKSIQVALGFHEPTDSITVDQVVEFLNFRFNKPTPPRIQILLLLCYHLLPTTAHSPDVPAASIPAAAINSHIALPARSANNDHIAKVSSSAVNAAVAAVNQMESLKPVKGRLVQQEHYGDGSVAKVTVQWSRTQPKEEADQRQMFAARCHTVIQYVDKMTEPEARIMFRILVREQERDLWGCPCGSDTWFSSCTRCPHTNELRKGTIDWINEILNVLPGHLTTADRTAGAQCFTCLLPTLPKDCPSNLKSVLTHINQMGNNPCGYDAHQILAPAIASLYRTSVRKVLGFPEQSIKSSLQVSEWLATPWPTIPYLSTIHRLYFLHHFLLPTTRHSPLTGGFVVINGPDPTKSIVAPYRGPSEANLTYMKEIEDAVMYAAIESVRPTASGTRTVEKSAADGTITTQVSHLDV